MRRQVEKDPREVSQDWLTPCPERVQHGGHSPVRPSGNGENVTLSQEDSGPSLTGIRRRTPFSRPESSQLISSWPGARSVD